MTLPTPIPARRRRMPRADRGEQLLNVAEQLFTTAGFQATSMDEIADQAGVTKPVLYDHYGSKDGLFAAVMSRAGAQLRAAIGAAVASAGSAEEAFAAGLGTYFSFIEERASAWSLLLTEAAAANAAAEAVEAVRREQAGFITATILAELPGAGAARAAVYAQAVIGACERLAACRRTTPALTADVAATQLMELLWVGFAGLRAGAAYSGLPNPRMAAARKTRAKAATKPNSRPIGKR
ncbi:MAG: TetR/AcrR family transcriptional regulator [Mycobacteriales bacterium]